MHPGEAQIAKWMLRGPERPWVTMAEISDAGSIDKRVVRHNLHTMRSKGYVARDDQPGSSRRYQMTTKGLAALAKLRGEYSAKLTRAGRPPSPPASWNSRHYPDRDEYARRRVLFEMRKREGT